MQCFCNILLSLISVQMEVTGRPVVHDCRNTKLFLIFMFFLSILKYLFINSWLLYSIVRKLFKWWNAIRNISLIISLSINLYPCLYLYLFLCLYLYLSLNIYLSLFISITVSLSLSRSLALSLCLSVSVSLSLCPVYLFLSLSLSLFLCLCLCLSVSLSSCMTSSWNHGLNSIHLSRSFYPSIHLYLCNFAFLRSCNKTGLYFFHNFPPNIFAPVKK